MTTLGILLITTKQCINIEKAKKYFQYFLANYVDEPVEIYYFSKDGNAREIAKIFNGNHHILRSDIPINNQFKNMILLYFYFVVCFKSEVLSEILCKKYFGKFFIDTQLDIKDLIKDLV